MVMDTSVTTIDDYIKSYPADSQKILQKIRHLIQATAPEAKEKIGYGIPTFTYHGNLVHFAAYQHHIGFYPGAEAIEVFAGDLKAYTTSKGAVQFPIDQPIPYELIKKITEFRVQKNTPKTKV